MKSQIIQRDTKLIGDELIEKFILGDKKVLKYINSFIVMKMLKYILKIKVKAFPMNKEKFL